MVLTYRENAVKMHNILSTIESNKYIQLIPKHYNMNDEMHRNQDSTKRPIMQSRSLYAFAVPFLFEC